MYVFANPNNASGTGVKNTAPTSAALRRSSATHFPARFLRHFLTMRSETRPENKAPAFSHEWQGSQIWFADQNVEARREGWTNSGYQYLRV